MSAPFGPDRPGEPPAGDIFAEVPLFREIHRVLSASEGPVNWELARQVGIAVASLDQADPPPTDDDRQGFEEAARLAELHIEQFTGLAPPANVAPVEAVRRAQWVQRNIVSLRELVEPAAVRLGRAVTQSRQSGPPGQEAPAAQMMEQLSPLLLGAQVGSVLGHLGRLVLGQYDIAVPRPEPGALLFVVPNIAAFERDWSLPPTDFRAWVALHEVTHRFEFARPWTRAHFRSLLEDFVSTLELNVDGLQEQLMRLDPSDPAALQSLLASEEGLFGTVLDDEQRLKLARVQSFMSAAEGYGDHVMHSLGRKILPSYPRIEEAMRRYRETETADPVFERLLGVEMKREQYRKGKTFCDRVAEQADEATLARMWDSSESLPSLPELSEPTLWLSRIA